MGTRKSINGSLWIIGQPLLLSAIGLPATAYVIRTLGPSGYGQWVIATALVGMVSVLVSPGLRPLFVRCVAQQPDQAGERLAHQLGLRTLLALGAVSIALAACLLLRYSNTILACAAITASGLVCLAVNGALEDCLQAAQCFKQMAMVNLVSGTLLTALSVVVVSQGGGPIGVAIAYSAGPIASLILLSLAVNRFVCRVTVRIDVAEYRKILLASRLVGGSAMLSALRDRCEQLFAPTMIGIPAFGIFAAGSILVDRLAVVSSGFAEGFFPLIAREHDHNKTADKHVIRLMVLTLGVCLPLALLVMLYSAPISALLFPKTAAECTRIIRITVWALPLMALAQPMRGSLQAANAHDAGARAGMLGTLCSVVLAFFLIRQWGITGACASMVARPAMVILFYIPPFVRTFPATLKALPFVRLLVCGVGMGGILWCVSRLGLNSLTQTLSGTALGLVVYASLALAFRIFNISELSSALSKRAAEYGD